MNAVQSSALGRRVIRFVRDERALLGGIAGVGGLKVGAMLAGVLTTILLARLLGADGLGQYAFAFSTAALLTLPVLQGLPVLVLRESSRLPAESRRTATAALIRYADSVVGIAALVIVVVWWAVRHRLGGDGFGVDVLLTTAGLALPLVGVLTLVRSSVLRAEGLAVAGQVADLLVRPFGFLALLLIAWWALPLTAGIAMTLHVIAAGAALGWTFWQLHARLPPAPAAPSATRPAMAAWTAALLPLSTLGGMQVVNSQVDLVILGLYRDDADVGIYRVATLLALQVSFMLTIVNAVAAPKFASLYAAGKLAELRRLNRISAFLSFVFGAALFVVYVVFGQPLIAIAVGNEYAGAWLPLLVLSGAHVASLWAGTTNVLLNMIGREKDVLVAATVSVSSNVLLNLLLVPRFGTLGAAGASAGSLLIWRGLLSWFLARRLGVAPKES